MIERRDMNVDCRVSRIVLVQCQGSVCRRRCVRTLFHPAELAL